MKRYLAGFFFLLTSFAAVYAANSAAEPKPDNSLLADGPAFVKDWTPPKYPAEALKAKIGGRVVTRIIVDETGAVTAARVFQTPDASLGEAAVAAVKTWKFLPAVENGKPAPISMDVPLEFDAAKGAKSWKAGSAIPEHLLPQPVRRTSAAAKTTPPGGYPAALTERRLSGQVVFGCVVQQDGRATDVSILAASHSDFVLPALDALARWEFTPATQGDLTVSSELRGTVSFDSLGSTRTEVLAANGISLADGNVPANPPVIESATDVVWPYALLLGGGSGAASVEFTVQPSGKVTDVKVLEATHPDFGASLAAAVEQWGFSPAMNEGRRTAATLVKREEFKGVPLDDETASDSLRRLVRLARAKSIRGGGGLDAPIVPLYRVGPVYPAALAAGERPSGNALLEFVIDRDGRVRLPRIVSATHEAFGWSAATAAAQWIFQAPRRNGEPTEVKVQIPFNFAPPPL